MCGSKSNRGSDGSVSYNGILMNVIAGTMSAQAEKSSDGVDALYMRHDIDFAGWLNPAVGSYDATGAAQPGNLAGLTYNNIKQLLETPRAPLIVVAGGATVINSPAAGYTVDANNGPATADVFVHRMDGIRTWAVRMKISTWVPYRPRGQGDAGLTLLSNRWEMMSDVGEDWLATRVIEGVAEFAVDELTRATLTADSFRSAFMSFTPPLNFQRIDAQARVVSDGTSVHYRVVDQEKFLNLGAGSIATRIDGQVYGGFSQGGFGRILAQGAVDLAARVPGAPARAAIGAMGGPAGLGVWAGSWAGGELARWWRGE